MLRVVSLRALVAEAGGTAVLLASVVGSGIMAQNLTTDVGLQLLVNAGATVAALGVIIAVIGEVSGAHVNPAVTLALAARKDFPGRAVPAYVLAQLVGAVVGVGVANVMFTLDPLQVAATERGGAGQLLGEVVATAGLVLVVCHVLRPGRSAQAPVIIPAWIFAAYFFTSSTSFANPAVTFGRIFSDTFAGIEPVAVVPFIAAQLVGAALAVVAGAFLFRDPPIAQPVGDSGSDYSRADHDITNSPQEPRHGPHQ